MSTTLTATLGPKGRVVVPHELRVRRGWEEGSVLVFTEDDEAAVRLCSAEDALARFRASVAGTPSPVDELIDDRRRAALNGD